METWNLYESTNFLVISDHGLIKVEEHNQFYIEECLADYTKVRQVANSLSFVMLWPVDGEEVWQFFLQLREFKKPLKLN